MLAVIRRPWLPLIALALLSLFALIGCSSNNGNDMPPLATPVEQGTIGSVSGTVYSLVNGFMDLPGNVPVTLTAVAQRPNSVNWPPAGFPRRTTTNVIGSYQFPDVPVGIYKVSVEDTVNSLGQHAAGEVTNIVVRGNIPTLNVNILIGNPDDMVTFNGTVLQDGAAAANATVTVEVVSRPFPESSGSQRAAYVTTTTDSSGAYQLIVPNNRNPYTPPGADSPIDHYAISAHSATSDVAEPEWYYPPILTSPVTVPPIHLTTLSNPEVTAPTYLFVQSVTLPKPTVEASLQVAYTQLAIARATGAPATRIASLQRKAESRQAASRSLRATTVGIVENDLSWDALQLSIDVQGYHVYRAPAAKSTYTRIGSTYDPYNNVFVDNDPALPLTASTYYTVTSYAANGRESARTWPPTVATPLPGFTNVRGDIVTLPAGGGIPARDIMRFRWDPIDGARSYAVIIYTDTPSFNTLPADIKELSGLQTTYDFTDPVVGQPYWWVVVAYNTEVGQTSGATSVAFSDYQTFTWNP